MPGDTPLPSIVQRHIYAISLSQTRLRNEQTVFDTLYNVGKNIFRLKHKILTFNKTHLTDCF